MQRAFYPCVYAEDPDDGGFVVVVPGINVNAQGETLAEALTEAAEILQEVVSDLLSRGEEVPAPAVDLGEWFDGQRPAVLQVNISAEAA